MITAKEYMSCFLIITWTIKETIMMTSCSNCKTLEKIKEMEEELYTDLPSTYNEAYVYIISK